MGQTTPNIGIYIPAAGETNYDQAFASGMQNIDAHDHSGGPNKGAAITTTGIAPFAVTFDKLNANVIDTTSGLQVNGALPNQIQLAPILKSIFTNATNGYLVKSGTSVISRTLTVGTSASLVIQNDTGVAGNSIFDLTGVNLTNNAFSAGNGSTTVPVALGDNTVADIIYGTLENIQPAASGAYNIATGVYTIPTTGYYLIYAGVTVTGVSGAGNETKLSFVINGATDQALFNAGTDTMAFGGADNLFFSGTYTKLLNAGALVKIQAMLNQAAANTVTVTGGRFQMVQLC